VPVFNGGLKIEKLFVIALLCDTTTDSQSTHPTDSKPPTSAITTVCLFAALGTF